MLPRAVAASTALLAAPVLADVHVAVGGPVPIPDLGATSLAVAVPDDLPVRDVDVLVRLAHPSLSSLIATLRHPDGSAVALFALPAADGELFLASFDDEAGAELVGSVPARGSFHPAAPLAALDGKRTLGTWRLEVRDTEVGGTGTLGGFALAFDGRTYVSTDAPKPIPSSTATLSTLAVPHAHAVLDAEVGVDIAHPWLADVSCLVQGPGTFTPLLFDHLGIGAGMVLGVLDDEAPLAVDDASPPYTGRFAPLTPGALAALDGSAAPGTWYLNLFDDDLEDDGELLGWWLHLVTDELPPATEPCELQHVVAHPAILGLQGAVEVDGERLFVGLPQAFGLGGGSGEVRILERDPGSGDWVLAELLVAEGGKSGAHFGWALAADGERLAVGAPNADFAAGNVSIFERSGDAWSLTAEVSLPGSEGFGRAVDLVGDRLAVGAVGRAHVLELVGGAWTPILATPASAHLTVGTAVALAGDELLVGDPNESGTTSSRVLVFPIAGGPATALMPSVGNYGDRFGDELSVSGDAFATGAWGYDGQGNSSGAAFVFRRGPTGWVEEAFLEPAGLQNASQFGSGVEVVGDTLWVSASGFFERNARRYQRGPNAWVLVETFAPAGVPQLFGETLAAGPDWVLVGSSLAKDAFAFAVSNGSLASCTTEVSVSAGGEQALELDAGPERAGDFYVLVGTASGTAPALSFGGVAVPIVVDPYTLFALGSPGASPLGGAIGALDAVGRADASFVLPAGADPAYAGLELNHAFVVLDAVSTAPVFASAPLALRLVP